MHRWRILLALVAVGCDGGTPSPDAASGLDAPSADGCAVHTECEACIGNFGNRGCEWCPASGSCVAPLDEGGSCGFGAHDDVQLCDEPRLSVPSTLATDCRMASDDPRCVEPRGEGAGSVGDGPHFDLSAVTPLRGACLDPTRGRLLLAAGVEDTTRVIVAGLFAVDLATGDRSLVSGMFIDEVLGTVTAGSGPEFDGELMDCALGADGQVYVHVGSSTTTTTVVRVDPVSGERTVLATDSDAARLCAAGSVTMSFARFANVSGGWSGNARIAVGPTGAIYGALRGPNQYGIGELTGSTCRVVTLSDGDGGALNVGTGPENLDYYRGFALRDGSLYTMAGSARLYRVDVATGNRTYVSGDAVGEGGPMAEEHVSLTADGTTAITSHGGFDAEEIVTVDLTSGDRTPHVPLGGPLTAGQVVAAFAHPTDPGVVIFVQPLSVGLYELATGNSVNLSY